MRTEASTGELVDTGDGDTATADQPAANGQQTMRIKVASPFKTYYDEAGYSISGVNETGPFDILPRHHNFMSLLQPGELVIRPVRGNAKEQRIRISGGLMHVKADKITVFLDI
jgi:F-type H+-transporting ATPase subunit epsilon